MLDTALANAIVLETVADATRSADRVITQLDTPLNRADIVVLMVNPLVIVLVNVTALVIVAEISSPGDAVLIYDNALEIVAVTTKFTGVTIVLVTILATVAETVNSEVVVRT